MANGNFAGGDGTENNPFLIEDAFDLQALNNNPNVTRYYELVNDIDLGVSPYNEGEGWMPIGNGLSGDASSQFRGQLDGKGYTIYNLYINRPDQNFTGLFGRFRSEGAVIKNLCLKNADVTGRAYNGVLVGQSMGSSIIANCSVNGIIHGTQNSTGGLSGSAMGEFINCYSNVVVTGLNYRGGLIGASSSAIDHLKIENCYSIGSVIGSTSNRGGLISTPIDRNPSVINSFWDTEASGVIESNGGIGKTTVEMQTAQTFIDAGWDQERLDNGTPVWILKDGEYPRLWFEKKPSKTLILSGEKFWKYDFDNSNWIDLGSVPTDEADKETLISEEGMLDEELATLNSTIISQLGNNKPKVCIYIPN